MDRTSHWQSVYETRAETEVSWFQERPASSLTLIGNAGLARGAEIVDVGGGASRLVDSLLDQGFAVTVLDVAPAALERAKRRLGERAPRVQWIEADVTHWRPAETFALWHDRAVFHFLQDPVERAAYAAAMAAAVPRGGHAIVGAFAADGPERCSGLAVRRYDAETLAAEFAADFEPVEALREDHVTPGGKIQHFQFCRFVRR